MVAPLFAISLLWERFDWRSSKLLRPRSFTWRIGSVKRTLSGTQLASGLLLLLLGVTMLWIGLTLKSMFRLTGWQAAFAYQLQHIGTGITHVLAWIPNWLTVVLVIAVILLLARRALRQVAPSAPFTPSSPLPQRGATQPDESDDEEAKCNDDSLMSVEKGSKG